MRKSRVTVVMQLNLDNEKSLLTAIVAWLQKAKTDGTIDSATITTEEISVPETITI